jgi:hypothetical protein
MKITFTKYFKENLLHGTGIKVSLLGYIFCNDDLSKLDIETLNIDDLKEVYDNDGKPFNFTYIPALEGKLFDNGKFEGVLGTYDIPLNKGLFKDFPNITFHNVIIIGKYVEENNYIIKKDNDYIAAIIDLEDKQFNETTNCKLFLNLTFVENELSSSAEMIYDNGVFERFADVESNIDLTTISATKQIILTPLDSIHEEEDSIIVPLNMTLLDTSEKINNNWNTSPNLLIGSTESNGITSPQISFVNSGENYTNTMSFTYDHKNHYFGINQDTGNKNLHTELVSNSVFSASNDNVYLNTTGLRGTFTNTTFIQSNGFIFNSFNSGVALNSHSIVELMGTAVNSLLLNVNGYSNDAYATSDVIIGSTTLYFNNPTEQINYVTVIGNNISGSLVTNEYQTNVYGDFWNSDPQEYDCEKIEETPYATFNNNTLIGFSGLTLNKINSKFYDNPYTVIFGNYNANDNIRPMDSNCKYRAIKGYAKESERSDRYFDEHIHFNHTQDNIYTNHLFNHKYLDDTSIQYDEGDFGLGKIFVVANGSSYDGNTVIAGHSPAEFASNKSDFVPNGIRLDLFSVEKNSYQLVHKFDEDFLFNGEATLIPGMFAVRGTKPVRKRYYYCQNEDSNYNKSVFTRKNINSYLLQNALYSTSSIYIPLDRTSNDVYEIPFDKLLEFQNKSIIEFSPSLIEEINNQYDNLLSDYNMLNRDYPNNQFCVSFTDIKDSDTLSLNDIVDYFGYKLNTEFNIIYLFNDSEAAKTYINEKNESIEVAAKVAKRIFYTPSQT